MAHDPNDLPPRLRDSLEDLVGELSYARRTDDLGRLASLCYCEIRRWARAAGEERLAELSSALVADQPARDRRAFMDRIEGLVVELEQVCERAGVGASLVERVQVTASVP